MKTPENKINERERFLKELESETPDKEKLTAMYDDICADRDGLQNEFRFLRNR